MAMEAFSKRIWVAYNLNDIEMMLNHGESSIERMAAKS